MLACEFCQSENFFITALKQATCRDCGLSFEVDYNKLPTERQIKEAIYEATDQSLKYIEKLKVEFFFHEDHKLETYFNICQFLKFGAMIPNENLPYVVTLWQPWATLYAAGLKLIETRPKPTKARGTILIHAAKLFTNDQRALCRNPVFKKALASIGYANPDDLPLGAIVGAVDITQTKKIIDVSVASTYKNEIDLGFMMIPPDDPEKAFGDYSPNRHAWIGTNHRTLEEPFPYTNGQGYYLKFRGDYLQLKFKSK